MQTEVCTIYSDENDAVGDAAATMTYTGTDDENETANGVDATWAAAHQAQAVMYHMMHMRRAPETRIRVRGDTAAEHMTSPCFARGCRLLMSMPTKLHPVKTGVHFLMPCGKCVPGAENVAVHEMSKCRLCRAVNMNPHGLATAASQAVHDFIEEHKTGAPCDCAAQGWHVAWDDIPGPFGDEQNDEE